LENIKMLFKNNQLHAGIASALSKLALGFTIFAGLVSAAQAATVAMTIPKVNGAFINGNNVTIAASTDVISVRLKAETFVIGSSATRDGAGNFVVTPAVMGTIGSRTFNAEGLNAAGAVLITSSVAVSVSNLEFATPASGAAIVSNSLFTLTVGAGTQTSKVDYSVDAVALGSYTNKAENFKRDTTLLNTGARVLKAISYNSAGTKIAEVTRNITITVAAPTTPQAALDQAVQNAKNFAPGIIIGVTAINLANDAKLSTGGTTVVNHASSAKWLWLAAALNSNTIAEVEPDAIPTMRDSNNTTAGNLIDLAGGLVAINIFSETRGIPDSGWNSCSWNYDKTRTDSSCFHARLNNGSWTNFFTSEAASVFLVKVARNQLLTDSAKSAKLREWALLSPDTGYGGWIGTQLPASVQPNIMHKEGDISVAAGGLNTLNEIGIVPTASGKNYVVAIVSEKAPSYAQATKSVEYLSCAVYQLIENPTNLSLTGCTLQ
jgi:beta-lactamase class A